MNHPLGSTRNVVKERYALFTPNGVVPSRLPGWDGCVVNVLISRGLGAHFVQLHIALESGGRGAGATLDCEWFVYLVEGACSLKCAGAESALEAGQFAFLPAGISYEFNGMAASTRLLVFKKTFEPLAEETAPAFLVGKADDIAALPFLGNPHARLQTLLPDLPQFDMAVNIFTYDPGVALPFVETHIMEHGLLMLSGAGIYRLGEDWHPVQAGDVIWMAPYCPQWFVAMGDEPARYIYYKNVNRAPL
jgi:(S)-ureidoglycine aminohydrolase